ncbi:Thiol-disulfide oxidoreductase LTO1 [Citrus sinensis]|nr:Thiol-disulfide oxidoreductase LTO1 [Citrus sinensis]
MASCFRGGSGISSISSLPSLPHRTRLSVLPVKCLSSRQSRDSDSDSDLRTTPSPSSTSGFSPYGWCAGIGGVGFLETTYLSYLKLTNSDAFCPIGGASCGDVLNSDYAVVFGVPLPFIGMFAYGLVAVLGLLLARKSFPIGINESYGRLILLGSSTSMAAASAYFLYILSTIFSGATCSYCLTSALLSFSLFFISLKVVFCVGVQCGRDTEGVGCTAIVAEANLPFFETEITTSSSPFALSLAKHLHAIGAKMYGAFWCSHCLEQKQMFGSEAVKQLNYVECFPDGYRKGTKIAKACSDAKIEGFPTWVINGQVLSGEQDLSDLAKASGFPEMSQPS